MNKNRKQDFKRFLIHVELSRWAAALSDDGSLAWVLEALAAASFQITSHGRCLEIAIEYGGGSSSSVTMPLEASLAAFLGPEVTMPT